MDQCPSRRENLSANHSTFQFSTYNNNLHKSTEGRPANLGKNTKGIQVKDDYSNNKN